MYLSQLIARLRLTVKRRFKSLFADYFNRNYWRREVPSGRTRSTPPSPLFPPRGGMFEPISEEEGSFRLTFLNRSRRFELPAEWHPPELSYGTHLWVMNLHYHEFLEEADDDWFARIVDDWIEQNPPYREGYWRDSWNAFSLSIRTVVWMQQLAGRSGRLDPAFRRKAADAIYRQLLFLERNIEEDIRSNHILKNIKALFWGSAFWEENGDTRRWYGLAESLLKRELDEQVLSDGMHFERSPAYHCQVLADLVEMHHVMGDSGLKERLESKLVSMGEALAQVMHPDGKVSLFNDGGLHAAYSPGVIREVLEKTLGETPGHAGAIRLPEAGYYGLRKGDSYFLYDAGKVGPDYLPAHAHGDIFSFEWSVGERRFVVDKGVYEYHEGPRREASRSTRSHNTVTVGRADQCEFWGAFRVARRAVPEVENCSVDDRSLRIIGSHDGYRRLRGRPVHRRSVAFDGERLEVADEVRGGDGQPVEARILFAPGWLVEKSGEAVLARDGSLAFRVEAEGEMEVRETEWFPDFGVARPCRQLIIRYGEAPCRGEFTIVRGRG